MISESCNSKIIHTIGQANDHHTLSDGTKPYVLTVSGHGMDSMTIVIRDPQKEIPMGSELEMILIVRTPQEKQ